MLKRNQSRSLFICFLMLVALMLGYVSPAAAQKKPHILVIFGGDVGQSNISAYTRARFGGADEWASSHGDRQRLPSH
ncbi:hypothetical protein [Variovorax sp. HJSM1_2]|uniref:hypothetical protein n=1 Tax=Variovorax sp. HJSM1_2 TaxID=3366263 RepID=UPI003BCA017A